MTLSHGTALLVLVGAVAAAVVSVLALAVMYVQERERGGRG
jgi:hypothetical protein